MGILSRMRHGKLQAWRVTEASMNAVRVTSRPLPARVARWALNGLTAMSLLLCLTSAGLWIRGSFGGDCFSQTAKSGRYSEVSTYWDQITLITAPRSIDPDRCPAPFTESIADQPTTERGELLWSALALNMPVTSTYAGIVSVSHAAGPTGTIWAVHGPTWLPVVLFALLPACWLAVARSRELLRRRWLRLHVCLTCGYDLTGNESGTCPECGTPWRAADQHAR